jgi:hypothetical protein
VPAQDRSQCRSSDLAPRIGTSSHGPGQRHDRFARVLVADMVRDRYAKIVYRHPPSRARKRFVERPERRFAAPYSPLLDTAPTNQSR